jgi:hypothetical protein
MRFDDFRAKIYEYIDAENLDDLRKAKNLLEEGTKKFTGPDEIENMGNISSRLFRELSYLLARDKLSTCKENDDYFDDEDDDDVIRCGPSTNEKVEYISG